MNAALRPSGPRCTLQHGAPFDEHALRHYAGTVLRQRRKALWLSVATVAEHLSTTRATVNAYELGHRPVSDVLLAYAHFLQVPYARLFPGALETPMDLLIRRLLAAPPYVHELFTSILDMPERRTVVPHVPQSDAS